MRDEDWKKQDPLELFAAWFKDAKATPSIREPSAMALATVSRAGLVDNRIVLLKDFSDEGFVFYTNYNSPKGRALDETHKAAATFYWDPVARQCRLRGAISRVPRPLSEAYWNSRARDSQLSQYISHQSEPVTSREELEALVHKADEKFKASPIPCPPHWGGYSLTPVEVEFWEGRPGRLHDRFLFRKSSQGWACTRLCP